VVVPVERGGDGLGVFGGGVAEDDERDAVRRGAGVAAREARRDAQVTATVGVAEITVGRRAHAVVGAGGGAAAQGVVNVGEDARVHLAGGEAGRGGGGESDRDGHLHALIDCCRRWRAESRVQTAVVVRHMSASAALRWVDEQAVGVAPGRHEGAQLHAEFLQVFRLVVVDGGDGDGEAGRAAIDSCRHRGAVAALRPNPPARRGLHTAVANYRRHDVRTPHAVRVGDLHVENQVRVIGEAVGDGDGIDGAAAFGDLADRAGDAGAEGVVDINGDGRIHAEHLHISIGRDGKHGSENKSHALAGFDDGILHHVHAHLRLALPR